MNQKSKEYSISKNLVALNFLINNIERPFLIRVFTINSDYLDNFTTTDVFCYR